MYRMNRIAAALANRADRRRVNERITRYCTVEVSPPITVVGDATTPLRRRILLTSARTVA